MKKEKVTKNTSDLVSATNFKISNITEGNVPNNRKYYMKQVMVIKS